MLTTHSIRAAFSKWTAAGPTATPVRTDATGALPPPLADAIWLTARALVGAIFVLQVILTLFPNLVQVGARYLFVTQDQWWLLLAALFLTALSWRQPVAWSAAVARPMLAMPQRTLAGLIVAVLAIALAGTYLVHLDYALVRDELMVLFDAEIFGRGKLAAAVAPEWREYAPALLPRFGLPILNDAGWVSSYLPGNAAFRALVGSVLVPQLANPLLAALAIWATYRVARQLWPDRPDAALVAVLLMATSTQMLIMAMTSFAMTGHMAFTMLWLHLFLRNDRIGHAGAIATGFVVTGWHQLIFHPLLVAPFVLHLWWTRRFKLAAVYTVAYALIGLFWVGYWTWFSALSGFSLGGATKSGMVFFVQRVVELLDNISVGGLVLMALNFARLVAWQNPLLVPLMLTALLATRSMPAPLKLASAGLCVTMTIVLLLMPFQGHGWGYRYLHGYIGVLCLIAAAGWIGLVPREQARTPAAWTPMVAACGFVLFVLLPAQALQVRAFLTPHAKPFEAILRSKADIVVVDERTMFYGEEFVRNDPFLVRKPIMLNLEQLDRQKVARLCERGAKVAIFDRETAAPHGVLILDPDAPKDWDDGRKSVLSTLPCVVPLAVR